MEIRWCTSRSTFDALAADQVAALLARKPAAAIAFPTGLTPVGLYAELTGRVADGSLSLDQCRLFDLDEYVGLSADDPQSYAQTIRRQFAEPAHVPPKHLRLIRGDHTDADAECREYERAIAVAGGLDLAILGLGANGHIAFNEPGTAWDSATHVATLSAATRAANAMQFAPGAQVPEHGITMGIATIRAAREILLLVAGDSKQHALSALRSGTPSLQWPVTALASHPNLMVIADATLSSLE